MKKLTLLFFIAISACKAQPDLEFKGLKIGSNLAETKSIIQNLTCTNSVRNKTDSCKGQTTLAGVKVDAELEFKTDKLMRIGLFLPDSVTDFMTAVDALKKKYGDTPMTTEDSSLIKQFIFTWKTMTGSIFATIAVIPDLNSKSYTVNFVSNEELKKREEIEQNLKKEKSVQLEKDLNDL